MQKEDGMFLLWESFENGYIPLDSNLYRKKSQLYQISPYISLKTNKGEHLFMPIGQIVITKASDRQIHQLKIYAS